MTSVGFEGVTRGQAIKDYVDLWGLNEDHAVRLSVPNIGMFINEEGTANISLQRIMAELKISGIEITNSEGSYLELNWSHNASLISHLISVYSKDNNPEKLPPTLYDFTPSILTYSGIIEM